MHILSSVVPSISPRSSPLAGTGTDETFSRMSSNTSGEKNNLIDIGTLYHINFTACFPANTKIYLLFLL